jgi:FixJ family two-component response regulator
METRPFVAIVDDDRLSRMFLANVLESAEIASVCFEFLDHFLDYTDVYKPACILLNMDMRGLNGAEVECRFNELGSTAPVIVMAGDSDIPTATAALQNGAVEVFTKPIKPLELLTLIRKLLIQDTGDQDGSSLAA